MHTDVTARDRYTLSVEFTLQGPQNTKTQNTALRRARPKLKNTKHTPCGRG
jgi:hypothetical protein